jgi:chemotaxis-related protein WspD
MNGSSQTATSPAGAIIADCWNKIGVRGDGSCPELQQHIHCRNCPTYTAAAAGLLDRDLPSAYLDEWKDHFSQERRLGELDTESIVVFRIGDEWLGLPTAAFSEFVDMRAIHSLPHRRHGVLLGLANVRGELLICVSLDKVLGIAKEATKPRQRAAYSRLVVIRNKDGRIVFPVDEVHGIHRFHPGELTAVPATVAKATATHTKAMLPWEGQAIGCLDDELLFYTLNRSLA